MSEIKGYTLAQVDAFERAARRADRHAMAESMTAQRVAALAPAQDFDKHIKRLTRG